MNPIHSISKRPTVLIVDDIPSNLMVLSDLLSSEYDVKIAKSAQKGLDIIEKDNRIDLILLDIIMPEMDGYEMCKILKNDPKTSNIPVIFVTAKDDAKDEEYGLNIGAIDYITKPFNPTVVKLRVRNHIELKRKSDLLEELSMYDGLTHIPNRRYFDERFAQCVQQSARDNTSLAVMMIDIDYFKPYNDNYGHGRGDETLKKVAQSLVETLKRPNDFVARYGGEEFVVILRDIDLENSQKLAQKLVDNVAHLDMPHEYSKHKKITISLGLAFCNTPKESDTLLHAADEALYEAKHAGKNSYTHTVCD